MSSAATRTQMLPAQATKPRLKIPLWFDIINVPKPIVVVKAARMTPLPVLKAGGAHTLHGPLAI